MSCITCLVHPPWVDAIDRFPLLVFAVDYFSSLVFSSRPVAYACVLTWLIDLPAVLFFVVPQL